jgi:hypothetical protein
MKQLPLLTCGALGEHALPEAFCYTRRFYFGLRYVQPILLEE